MSISFDQIMPVYRSPTHVFVSSVNSKDNELHIPET